MQIKTTRDNTTHLSESLLSKRQEMYVGENVKKGSPCTLSGNVSWCRHYGKQHGGASENKNSTITWPSNYTPGH